jgi:hypothetical protein
MPASSKAQQKLMGMAYALKKGDMPRSEASQEVKDLADNMTLKQLKDFAETSHKDLPERKTKKIDEYSLGSYYTGSYFWFTQASQAGVQKVSMTSDKQDPVVQQFIDYISGKDVNEGDFGTGISASPSNVPGMGNAAPPSADSVGSGDVFNPEEDDPNRKVGLMSFSDYKKWLKKHLNSKDN